MKVEDISNLIYDKLMDNNHWEEKFDINKVEDPKIDCFNSIISFIYEGDLIQVTIRKMGKVEK